MAQPFHSLYTHGFIRVAVCVPDGRVGDPAANAAATLALARRASEAHAAVALFPELGISSYAIDDLLQQDALLDAVEDGLASLVDGSRNLTPMLLVGAPLRLEGKLFNCAVVIYRGTVLGIVPKTYLPNYREFYEKRHFTSGRDALSREVTLRLPSPAGRGVRGEGFRVPFGNDLIFAGTADGTDRADDADREHSVASSVPGARPMASTAPPEVSASSRSSDTSAVPRFALHVEICEDVWTPIPPSTYAALAGATVLANLSASNITVGKAAYRRLLCGAQSGRCVAAYLYSAAGPGESTTDLAWDGYALIYENGDLLAEGDRFAPHEQMVIADIDLDRLRQERMRLSSFNDTVGEYREKLRALRTIAFEFQIPTSEIPLEREVARFPYVPRGAAARDARCFEAYNIQVHGLMQRLRGAGITQVVIGISGGLDSTQALIVAARAFDRLGLPRANIRAYTMPGFATSTLTRANAHALMRALEVTGEEIDIRPSCMQMLRDLGHPFAGGEPVYDVTFENVQAGERTSHLFRLANYHNALVVGTGDLSEMALGWSTYGVGDQMSHYNVNASVPKTLIQYLIRWVIGTGQFDAETCATLQSILETEISPELVPHAEGAAEKPAQSSQERIGPYELQDFNLYYLTRFGFRPSKIAYLAYQAWRDAALGAWPEGFPDEQRRQYDLATIAHWLEVFLYRFFTISQFKRSASPNGPKVGSGGSLSPRGDWRAPSDGNAQAWLAELHAGVPLP